MSSILLKNGSVIDVVEKRIARSDVLIKSGKLYLSGGEEAVDEVIDLKGAHVSPGFIDGHIHIESSMLPPLEFSYASVACGTTSVFVDPHEITNVLGIDGVKFFLEQAELVPFNMNIGVPACVPATHMETSGGMLTIEDIRELLKEKNVYGLAEMMNFPGIVRGIGDARDKVKAALEAGKIADGHCPGLSGEGLSVYISNGENDGKVRIGSDHECTTVEEAIEKREKGMYVMLRHGSGSKDLENILPGICRRGLGLEGFGLVSDDLSAPDLKRRGHMDHLISIASGIIRKEKKVSPEEAVVEAIAMATVNHAAYFRKNAGKISDGADADLVVFDDLEEIRPRMVISGGDIVVRDGRYIGPRPGFDYDKYARKVEINDDFAGNLKIASKKEKETARVIEAKRDTLITGEIDVEMPVDEGVVRAGEGSGIAKIAVIERHKGTGNMSVGFIKGFGFGGGAIASTVAHDSHNLIVVGMDDGSIVRAVNVIRDMGGGLAAVHEDGEASLPLQLGGLMSTGTIETVISQHEELNRTVRKMGFSSDPFLMLSFMALPVIPRLKITDKGLVDVEKFDFVGLLL